MPNLKKNTNSTEKYDLLVITYFYHEYGEKPNFNEDYTYKEIYDKNGQMLTWYGDGYHDNGYYKVEGFIEGYTIATGINPIVKYENKGTKLLGSKNTSLLKIIKATVVRGLPKWIK